MQEGVDGDGGKVLGAVGDKNVEAGVPSAPIEDDEPETMPLGVLLFGGAHIGTKSADKPRPNGMRGQRRSTPEASTVPGRELFTTTEAARYCGFKTPGGLRKAWYQLLVFPAGRRGGRRTLMWERKELERFMRGEDLKKSQAAGVLMPPKLRADEEEP